ncbi:guanylyl cyclase 1 [Zea mays]|uniref:Guanylyl cyclase 1 n=1 Tax=Zea mays TaxID=4577 RepID=A0A1D6FP27_MAIZE|nr:guanylyl cyclase 1 [Zea mays]
MEYGHKVYIPSWFRMSWDCGLTCVLMVLKTLGIDRCDSIADLDLDLERLCHTTRSNCKMISINRVDELSGKAFDAEISVQCRSITAYDIALLSGHCIAIVLVDKSKLH